MLQACWIEWVAHVKKHVLLSSKLAPVANDMWTAMMTLVQNVDKNIKICKQKLKEKHNCHRL